MIYFDICFSCYFGCFHFLAIQNSSELNIENKPDKFLRRSLMNFMIKGFRTIVFILIIISSTFRAICPPAFFVELGNLHETSIYVIY